MRIAIFSDVHSNLEALNAVLGDITDRKPDRILFGGDAVGYGPDPDACVRKIFEVADAVVAGNHDHAVIGLTDIEQFNPYARDAILWTQSVLIAESRDRLRSMPLTHREQGLFLVHASPDRPEEWTYIFSLTDAVHQFEFYEGDLCLIGHTHRLAVFFRDGSHAGQIRESILTLQANFRYIVNVGSVGQPRDRNPHAAYALYDTNERRLSFHRVQYDFRKTQEKMRAAHLPPFLIERLEHGI